MITIDGSEGEGGGQMLRTALALSVLTNQAFCMQNIRKGRPNPGLKRQHLSCIESLKELCGATVEGATHGSGEITFYPRPVRPKNLSIDIGTAGSVTLVLQSLLLPCLFAPRRMKLTITGGTDAKWAMPIDFFRLVLLPHLQKYAEVSCEVEKRGYYPTGGGKVTVTIVPKNAWHERAVLPRILLAKSGTLAQIQGVSHASFHLQEDQVAERQAAQARVQLTRFDVPIEIVPEYTDAACPGSGIVLAASYQNDDGERDANNPVILGSDALGEKGKFAERVGKEAGELLASLIDADLPVDPLLADNLIPFMALNPPGELRTKEITNHTRTNINIVERFLPVRFTIKEGRITCAASEDKTD